VFRFSDTQWHYGAVVRHCVFYMDLLLYKEFYEYTEMIFG